ncbi:MAG: hypothetical protein GWM90_24785, partial [Gemmatimonadetes bacterium]|nr:hypothetical protein [Gemmatimonadota bacterium]NIR40043.1 hypothetical protein [Actinomycetota bacterium]NIU78177.1 hypothetical protein [Gammaproteobacteria bacterium]NIQ57997.1 hypothetical protein [Gemmatimonadota bacterium]NIX23800.1 hypothetical protein [Actinomycetota bacterium]
HDPSRLQTVCQVCGMPLRVDLDLPAGAPEATIDPSIPSMWRYAAVLPVPLERAVTLVEGWSPLVEVEPGTWIK